ncbi:universal stress protein [Paenibacillus filicis]|uniref:Universal stress protein n=1 Tax=Paenibacillus gyeongsangnamensis TaxID=3388067 RepID=A0ABT4QD27_9BACL|nr:universal stress protein [Paenibacillus filicis]MCZ8514789.1 universal stress protein [Paenibacillus filicis]
MAYKHILVVYDGSDLAKSALDQAVRIVREHPVTRLTVLHVFHFPNILVGGVFYTALSGLENEYLDYAETLIEDARKAIEGLPYATVQMREGFPVETILEVSEEGGCDLVIMGSRGLSGLKEFMLGSVSHAVVQKAKMPVMIIKGTGAIIQNRGVTV